MTTADERLAAFAAKSGITVEAIKAHTMKVRLAEIALQEAKNAGATDAELIALATGKGTHYGNQDHRRSLHHQETNR